MEFQNISLEKSWKNIYTLTLTVINSYNGHKACKEAIFKRHKSFIDVKVLLFRPTLKHRRSTNQYYVTEKPGPCINFTRHQCVVEKIMDSWFLQPCEGGAENKMLILL